MNCRKQNEYNQVYANFYFWRNTEQREIDLIIEKNSVLNHRDKMEPNPKSKTHKSFTNIYGETQFKFIHRENFLRNPKVVNR